MPFVNSCHLMGNVTRDPQLVTTAKGTPKLELGLAINRSYTVEGTGETREEVVFVDLLFWNKSAENVARHIKKGRALYVEGSLIMDTWDDKQTGQKRSKLRVKVDKYQFIGGLGLSLSKEGDETDETVSRARTPQSQAARPQGQPMAPATTHGSDGSGYEEEEQF